MQKEGSGSAEGSLNVPSHINFLISEFRGAKDRRMFQCPHCTLCFRFSISGQKGESGSVEGKR